MKKRILSILLVCCMVLTLLPATAFAAEVETGAHVHRTRAVCANTTRSMTRPAAIPKGQRKFPVPMNTRRNVIV